MKESHRQHGISDQVWVVLEPLLPGRRVSWGGVAQDNRRFINAVLWILRTGASSRDLPAGLRWLEQYAPAVLPLAGNSDHASGWEPADLRALRVERSRDFGECYLALSLWHRLGLDSLLAGLLPPGPEQVGWAHTA
ncbi:MAG: hypothetical protein RIQ79_9, partial [Verrucomicrobiota bacterium]